MGLREPSAIRTGVPGTKLLRMHDVAGLANRPPSQPSAPPVAAAPRRVPVVVAGGEGLVDGVAGEAAQGAGRDEPEPAGEGEGKPGDAAGNGADRGAAGTLSPFGAGQVAVDRPAGGAGESGAQRCGGAAGTATATAAQPAKTTAPTTMLAAVALICSPCSSQKRWAPAASCSAWLLAACHCRPAYALASFHVSDALSV